MPDFHKAHILSSDMSMPCSRASKFFVENQKNCVRGAIEYSVTNSTLLVERIEKAGDINKR